MGTAHGYSSESTQQELSNEYQHDRVYMVSKGNLYNLVLWTKVASALEGIIIYYHIIKSVIATIINKGIICRLICVVRTLN